MSSAPAAARFSSGAMPAGGCHGRMAGTGGSTRVSVAEGMTVPAHADDQRLAACGVIDDATSVADSGGRPAATTCVGNCAGAGRVRLPCVVTGMLRILTAEDGRR